MRAWRVACPAGTGTGRCASMIGTRREISTALGPPADQDHAIAPSAPGRRKVVLATSIAETSLTIEGVRIVIDSGLKKWAIARTIIVYGVAKGLSRSNVVLWAKNALEKGQPIKVVDDQWRMPTLAEDLADGCIRIAKRGANGIFNLCGPDGMSILELVQRVGKFFDLDPSVITPVSSGSLGQPARRPPRTGFVLDKARRELGYAPRSFESGLAILRDQIQQIGRS